jgi:hypothetical protein
MTAAGLHNGTSNRHTSSVGAFAGLYWRLVNYEALNQYVLIAIALFAVLLYIGLICAGFAEFVRAIPKIILSMSPRVEG